MKIPPNNQWFQANRGDIFGSIWASFNIDLSGQRDKGRGKLRLARTLLGATSATLTNLGNPVAFRRYESPSSSTSQTTYAIAGGRAFKQGSAFSSSWAEVTPAPTTFSSENSDMEVFNGYLFISNDTADLSRYDGTTWTTVTWGTTTSGVHMLCVFGNRLYRTGGSSADSVIESMNTAQMVSTVGNANTITLIDRQVNCITFIRPSSNGIWIGTVNRRGGKGHVYFWDGASSTVQSIYTLESAGALSGIVKDDVLYIVDADAKLLAFNGGTFTELDRLPIKSAFLTFALGDNNTRWIHPNGMTVIDNRILILIDNTYYTGTLATTVEETVPAGIWEWSTETGLYHKYALSNTPTSGTGGGSIYDWGQERVSAVGALTFIKQDRPVASDNGTLFAGAKIFTDSSSTIYGIFIDDTNDTVQKYGYFLTPRIYSQSLRETWQKVFLRHKLLLDSSDTLTVKYRTSEVDPTEATITWTADNTITTTTSLASYAIGDEMEVIQGRGAGKCAHITSISLNAGTYTVVLDDTFVNVATTSKARFQKWKKCGSKNDQTVQVSEFTIDTHSPWIQLKVCMQFTGTDEIDDIFLINRVHRNAE